MSDMGNAGVEVACPPENHAEATLSTSVLRRWTGMLATWVACMVKNRRMEPEKRLDSFIFKRGTVKE